MARKNTSKERRDAENEEETYAIPRQKKPKRGNAEGKDRRNTITKNHQSKINLLYYTNLMK